MPCRYEQPRVEDYGDLVEMTAAAHVLMGVSTAHDLSFSSPSPVPGGGGNVAGGEGEAAAGGSPLVPVPGGANPSSDPSTTGHISVSNLGGSGGSDPGGSGSTAGVGGGGSGGGGSGNGGGGGGSLPFTGFAAGAAAAVGGSLTAAGTALRRYARARRAGR